MNASVESYELDKVDTPPAAFLHVRRPDTLAMVTRLTLDA
jgi:hypothetical protein